MCAVWDMWQGFRVPSADGACEKLWHDGAWKGSTHWKSAVEDGWEATVRANDLLDVRMKQD